MCVCVCVLDIVQQKQQLKQVHQLTPPPPPQLIYTGATLIQSTVIGECTHPHLHTRTRTRKPRGHCVDLIRRCAHDTRARVHSHIILEMQTIRIIKHVLTHLSPLHLPGTRFKDMNEASHLTRVHQARLDCM